MTDHQQAILLLAIYSSHIIGRGWNTLLAFVQLIVVAVYWWKGL